VRMGGGERESSREGEWKKEGESVKLPT
jgi:hypothetical protein